MANETEREYVEPWKDPKTHSDNCVLDKECMFWMQDGDQVCERMQCKKRFIVRKCD